MALGYCSVLTPEKARIAAIDHLAAVRDGVDPLATPEPPAAGVDLPDDIVNTTSMLVMISYLASSNALAPTPGPVADLFVANKLAGGLTTVGPEEQILVSPYYLISRRNVIISAVATRLRELVFKAMNDTKG